MVIDYHPALPDYRQIQSRLRLHYCKYEHVLNGPDAIDQGD
jgi:hypothetical protein